MSARLFPLLALLSLSAIPGSAAEELWAHATGLNLPLAIEVVDGVPPHIFVAQKSGGVLVLRESASGQPQAVGLVKKAELANLDAMNFHREGALLYVALGDHFAAGGSKAGLAVVDIRDPARPSVLATWESPERLGGAGDVAVANGYAYLGAMGEGLRIIDVQNPSRISLAAALLPDVHYPTPNPGAIAYPHARGVAIANGLLYVANDAGGLRIFDLAVPLAPREIGKYVNPRMPNKAQAFNNVVVDNQLAYLAVDYCGVEILDVSNPSRILQVGWWNPWSCHEGSNVWFNSGGHANGLQLDSRRKRLYVSGGDTDLIVLDVTNPASPKLAAKIGEAKDGFGTWDVAVHGERIYGTFLRTPIPFSGRWAGVKAFRLPDAPASPGVPIRSRSATTRPSK